jgi:hypothetical protein
MDAPVGQREHDVREGAADIHADARSTAHVRTPTVRIFAFTTAPINVYTSKINVSLGLGLHQTLSPTRIKTGNCDQQNENMTCGILLCINLRPHMSETSQSARMRLEHMLSEYLRELTFAVDPDTLLRTEKMRQLVANCTAT